nr:gliding motility-associated C-terminal domain-containing protein [uncultured Mucilaginibacter sp.]
MPKLLITRPLVKKAIALLAMLLGIAVKSYCQQFYVATSTLELKRITLTPNGIITEDVSGCGKGTFFSVAVSGTHLYYNTDNGALYISEINGGALPSISNCMLIGNNFSGTSLTVDKNGIIYVASGTALFSLQPGATGAVYLGDMPFYSAGDLLFYKDELYMAASTGEIVKIDITNPLNSTSYIPIGRNIMGFTTVAVKDQLKVYAFAEYANQSTDMLELDMENRTIKGSAGILPFIVYDAGSNAEAGEIPVIEIQQVDVSQDCNVFNKGAARVVCKKPTSQYVYTLDNGLSNRTGVFNNLTAGVYKVTVASDGEEDSKEATFTIPDYSLDNPVITATKTNPVCDVKGAIKLSAGNRNDDFRVLFNGSSYDFNHSFAGLSPGTYHFVITTAAGCLIDEKDFTMVQDACPPIEITDIQFSKECAQFGKAVVTVITKPHPDTYTYSFNGLTGLSNSFNNISPGTYTLVVTSSGGDRKEQQVVVPDVTLIDRPEVSYMVNNAVCTALGKITFAAAGDIKGAAKIKHGTDVYPFTKTIKGLLPGSHHFIILSQDDCILDELDIDIGQDKCEFVSFPNAFTPNGDGVNDILRPNQGSNPIGIEYYIYNRWGQQYFHSANLNGGWDGNYNGKPATAGVYYLVVKYTMGDGLSYMQNTSVTLLR